MSQSRMDQRFLEPIADIEGGWEYWIQIDFPAWLDAYYVKQYDFRREVGGIMPKARIDWVLNNQQEPAQTPIAVGNKGSDSQV